MTTLHYLMGTVARLKALVDQVPSYRWATVVQADPLRILLDGDTEPMRGTPENIAGPLAVGQRVLVTASRRRVYVIGRSGGMGIPTGALAAFAGVAAPPGWLLCDGSTLRKADFPALAATLGFTGAGDTFTVPDMRGRVPVGVHPSQAGLTALGAVGGEYTHTLTVDEMPSHRHDFTYNGNFYATWPYTQTIPGTGSIGFTAGTPIERRIGIANSGGDGEHNNMPPYFALNFIIKP